MDWRIKLVGERMLGVMPASIARRVHRAIQARFTQVHLSNEHQRQHEISRGLAMCRYIHDQCGFDFTGKRVLEIGTGWHGSDIALFHVLGAKEIWTCDILPHLEGELLLWMMEGIAARADEIGEQTGADAADVGRRAARALESRRLDELLALANVQYIAPSQFDRINFPSHHFDLFYSYSVLQRVPPRPLRRYLKTAHQALRPGSLSLHVIHHADHNSRHDPSLHPLNYLRYGRQYDLLQSRLFNYQNRLRHREFIDLLSAAGFTPLSEETTPGDISFVRNTQLAHRFRTLPPEDLAITRTQILCRRS